MARENPALTRHVGDLFPDFEHLLEAGEAVELMRATPGWAVVQALIQDEIDAINVTMERGTPLDQATYAARHGRIGGLKALRGAADAVVGEADRRRKEQQAKHEAAAEPVAEGV